MRSIRKLVNPETFIALVSILLVAIVTHGLRLKELGFYFDDWYVLWSAAARGAGSLAGVFYTDRPAMGRLYVYTYRLIGDSLLGWHLYTLAWRCVSGIAFFWILRILWPKQKFLSTLAAMLLLVYPGFLSQPDALTKVNHLTGYGLALASMALMLAGAQAHRRVVGILLEILALAAGSAYVWIYEYMIGLEAMRLALLGLFFYQRGVTRFFALLKALASKYWPYVITLSGFLYWRFFIFDSSRPATNVAGLFGSYGSNPLYMLVRTIAQTGLDFLSVTVFAWFVKPYQLLAQAHYTRLAVAAAVGLAGLLIVLLYRALYPAADAAENPGRKDCRTAREMAVVGAIGTLFAVFPVVVSNRSIDLLDAYKSYGLHPSAAAILLVLSGIVLLKSRGRQVVLLALLFVSMLTNSLSIDYWKDFWQMERSMWWQVVWRAPNIANDTFVMAYGPDGYRYMQDYEVWSPLNLIYRPGPAQAPSIQSEVLNNDTLLNVIDRNVTDRYVRDIPMHQDYGNLLLISQLSLRSCIHIIDGKMPVYSGNERLIVKAAGEYSNIDRIQAEGNAPTPPAAIFGAEPAHGWCYYYQKASLARQVGDWNTILDLYAAAQENGVKPADRTEYFPYLEALVNTGKIDEAQALFTSRIGGDHAVRASFCASLAVDPGYPPEFGYNYPALHSLLCGG